MKIAYELGTAARRVLATAAVTLGVVAGSLAVGASTPALACSCVQLDLPSLEKQGDAVFVGTPVSTEEHGRLRTYEVRVSDVYKGSPGSTTVVSTETQATACGVTLDLDTQYLVVGDQKQTHGTVTTSACSGTRPISDGVIADVEQALGPATPYRGPSGDTGGEQHGDDGQHRQHGDQDDNTSDGSENGSPGDNGETTDADAAADSSDDGMDTSYVVIGGVLVVALAASFLVPKLRRRHRSAS
ncbi:MAG: hypothetical protein ACRDO7_09995 [Nocardioidaceae bacterium]